MAVTVDTSVLIDILQGVPAPLEAVVKLEEAGHAPVLSAVAVFEALSGVEFTRSRTERSRLRTLLSRIPIESFDDASAERAAEVRAELLRAGRSPGAPDTMILGQALAKGHLLLTRDKLLAECGRAMGLEVVVC